MPTIQHRNIRSGSPASNAQILGDATIRRILVSPGLLKAIPELNGASSILRQAETGCRSCQRARRIRMAMSTAKSQIMAMTPKRKQDLKIILGVGPDTKLKLMTRKGARVVASLI